MFRAILIFILILFTFTWLNASAVLNERDEECALVAKLAARYARMRDEGVPRAYLWNDLQETEDEEVKITLIDEINWVYDNDYFTPNAVKKFRFDMCVSRRDL